MFNGSGSQIHDFNPGIRPSGLFWTACIDPDNVAVNPGNGSAVMAVQNLAVPDYHDLINALNLGPSVPGVVSFTIEWGPSNDKRQWHDVPSAFDANVVLNSAKAAWAGETALARYVSDPAAGSTCLFAEVGHERNGVFFS